MNRNTKRSVSLYENLTPKQQAAVCFNFLGEQDAQEASRVHEAVAWKTGRFKDADYTDWRDAMQSVCLIIGLEYWRLAAQRMAALAIMAEREGELYELADVNIKTLGERMAALQAVLRDL